MNSYIKPAERTKEIKYAVRDIILIAEKAAFQGKKMTYLNIGDPIKFDFETPRHIIEAVYNAMKDGVTGYSPSSGIDEAIESIKNEAHKKGIRNIQDAFITNGGSEAIEIALTSLVNPDENVLVPSPGYPLYTAVLAKLGAGINPYYLDEENDWQPDINDIKSKIDKNTRAIILINPNNPTGAVYTRETLTQIVDLALEHNLVIFSDEIYDKLVFDAEEHISTASISKEASILTFGGLSKSYLSPGLRIGWCVVSGKEENLGDYYRAMQKLTRARLCANHPEQYAIKPALEGDQSHIKEANAKLKRRADITYQMLNTIPNVSCVKPRGAFYAFPKIDVPVSDEKFVSDLIYETGVVVVPGAGFGQKQETKHFRIVFLPKEDILREAYEKIRQFITKEEF
ncbi:aminotransferase class I/II-fold pyridoxal phosphate-dependent enzyme [bacterium]|nr:aminotransferase class I/II-fold pyridoxal phosphate-dependent enzyme [bacterium]